MKSKTKNNVSNNSDLLSQSELKSLIQDMREAEIKMGEMIRSHPNFQKIKSLISEMWKYPPDSPEIKEISRKIVELQKAEYPNLSDNPTK